MQSQSGQDKSVSIEAAGFPPPTYGERREEKSTANICEVPFRVQYYDLGASETKQKTPWLAGCRPKNELPCQHIGAAFRSEEGQVQVEAAVQRNPPQRQGICL